MRFWCVAMRAAAPVAWMWDSYAGWNAALVDLSLRMAGLGWRNVLCETAFAAGRARRQPRWRP